MKGPRITLVAALDRNRLIGREGGLPWRLPADLRHFRRLTLGHPVVMGRRTHQSIARALPGRRNLVISGDPDFEAAPGCEPVASLAAALEACGGAPEVMVIGGAQVYAEALPIADRLELTVIDHAFEGDTWFPPFDQDEWLELHSREPAAGEEGPWPYRFLTLVRRSG
jgi:dihydrofolate reductase